MCAMPGRQLIVLSVEISLISLFIVMIDSNGSVTAQPPAATTAATAVDADNSTSSFASGFTDPKVWIVSSITILVISLVGLLCVALVPLVQSSYYNHFIQFLVALAVGSLTGDAMLHLLPHAIVKSAMEDAHAERCHNERQTVFKGLIALGGVYLFFMAEKVVALATEYRSKEKPKELLREHSGSSHDSDQHQSNNHHQNHPNHPNHHHTSSSHHNHRPQPVNKTCDEIITTGLNSVAMRNIGNLQKQAEEDCNRAAAAAAADSPDSVCPLQQQLATIDQEDSFELEDSERQIPGAVGIMDDQKQPEQQQLMPASTTSAAALARTDSSFSPVRSTSAISVGSSHVSQRQSGSLSRRASRQGRGHGHSHGHSHPMPESMASVAWMVILGDGLHNFTDGLAIGAAFAQNITGGISTSVAVLCHELPHELGDFAVLLKTGMKAKQALLYNLVSSVLAAIGMVIGICLANVTNASYWIFAVTGGIFIYISLVDMLPELNLLHVKEDESRIAHFLLQLFGIATGVGVMFLIAWFEHDIKGMLGDNDHHSEEFTGPC